MKRQQEAGAPSLRKLNRGQTQAPQSKSHSKDVLRSSGGTETAVLGRVSVTAARGSLTLAVSLPVPAQDGGIQARPIGKPEWCPQ